jgi:hypothetical protein
MDSNIDHPVNERAPILLVFGDLSVRVAGLLRVRPSLTVKVVFAPRAAIHSIGAFLHLAPEASGSDEDVAEMIDNVDPRLLLRCAIPHCPDRLFRALDRAGDRVRERSFYHRLGAVVAEVVAAPLMASGSINDARVSFYEALSSMDPVVANWGGVLNEDRYLAAGLDSLIALLRAHHVLRDEDMQLPPRGGRPAIERRIRSAFGRVEAPNPNFSIPVPFRLVRNAAELQCIGSKFQNCVALPQWHAIKYQLALINGTSVFLAADEPPLLAVMNRIAPRVWHLEQIAGPKNVAPPTGVEAALVRGLSDEGIKIVSDDPQSALGCLVQRPPRSLRHVGIGDDANEEDVPDWNAA